MLHSFDSRGDLLEIYKRAIMKIAMNQSLKHGVTFSHEIPRTGGFKRQEDIPRLLFFYTLIFIYRGNPHCFYIFKLTRCQAIFIANRAILIAIARTEYEKLHLHPQDLHFFITQPAKFKRTAQMNKQRNNSNQHQLTR